jgi:hypothetical protein
LVAPGADTQLKSEAVSGCTYSHTSTQGRSGRRVYLLKVTSAGRSKKTFRRAATACPSKCRRLPGATSQRGVSSLPSMMSLTSEYPPFPRTTEKRTTTDLVTNSGGSARKDKSRLSFASHKARSVARERCTTKNNVAKTTAMPTTKKKLPRILRTSSDSALVVLGVVMLSLHPGFMPPLSSTS